MATQAKIGPEAPAQDAVLGRTRAEIMASLTPQNRAVVEARTAELCAQVEGLEACLPSAVRNKSPKARA